MLLQHMHTHPPHQVEGTEVKHHELAEDPRARLEGDLRGYMGVWTYYESLLKIVNQTLSNKYTIRGFQ